MRRNKPSKLTLKTGFGLENAQEAANVPRVEREEIEAAALGD
jgi:hypothetical protein